MKTDILIGVLIAFGLLWVCFYNSQLNEQRTDNYIKYLEERECDLNEANTNYLR
jgi:hypothetical protein